MAEFKIPFGRAKDETLEETDGANITWVIGALEKKLIEEPGSRAQKNREWIAAGKAELAKRAGAVVSLPARRLQRRSSALLRRSWALR